MAVYVAKALGAGGQALQAEPLRATRRCRPRTPVTCYIHKIRHVMICKFDQRPQVQASNENEIGVMSGRLVKRLAYRRMLNEMKEGDDSVRSLMGRPVEEGASSIRRLRSQFPRAVYVVCLSVRLANCGGRGAASCRLFVVRVTTEQQEVPSSSSSSSSSVRAGYYQTHTESNVRIAEPRRLDGAFFCGRRLKNDHAIYKVPRLHRTGSQLEAQGERPAAPGRCRAERNLQDGNRIRISYRIDLSMIGALGFATKSAAGGRGLTGCGTAIRSISAIVDFR